MSSIDENRSGNCVDRLFAREMPGPEFLEVMTGEREMKASPIPSNSRFLTLSRVLFALFHKSQEKVSPVVRWSTLTTVQALVEQRSARLPPR